MSSSSSSSSSSFSSLSTANTSPSNAVPSADNDSAKSNASASDGSSNNTNENGQDYRPKGFTADDLTHRHAQGVLEEHPDHIRPSSASFVASPRPRNEAAFKFLESIGSPKFACAPMVDQSELPFRMLTRAHGTDIAYTPMIHARIFASADGPKRRSVFLTCKEDRPLVVQFCANDADDLVNAAKLVEHTCDAVDINFGCPQRIARNGNYGAFLLENAPLCREMVEALSKALKVPVFCKMRSLGDAPRSVEFARMLEDAGCQLITIHGRTKEEKGPNEGLADWGIIRAIKQSVGIPVFANGNIRTKEDAEWCMRATGADGVMSAVGLLRNPRLFAGGKAAPPPELCLEYLDMAEKYPPPAFKMIKAHIFWMAKALLNQHVDLRYELATSGSIDEYRSVLRKLEERVEKGIDGPKVVTDDIRQKRKKRMRMERAMAAKKVTDQAREAVLAAEASKRSKQ